jgi:hypothetical protein
MPKVRIFTPARDGGYAGDGMDYQFGITPRVGDLLRLNDHREADYVVTQVGHIQAGKSFIAAIWTAAAVAQNFTGVVEAYRPTGKRS